MTENAPPSPTTNDTKAHNDDKNEVEHQNAGQANFVNNPPAPMPNKWALLSDHAKTTLTLASGLLAISASLSPRLLDSGDGTAKALLVLAWVLLLLAVLASVIANISVINKVNGGKHASAGTKAHSWLNVGFVLIGVALLLISGAAWFANRGVDKSTLADTVESARSAVVDAYDVADDAVTVESYDVTPANTAEVVMDVSGMTYNVVVDLDSGDVLSVEPG